MIPAIVMSATVSHLSGDGIRTYCGLPCLSWPRLERKASRHCAKCDYGYELRRCRVKGCPRLAEYDCALRVTIPVATVTAPFQIMTKQEDVALFVCRPCFARASMGKLDGLSIREEEENDA